AHRIFCKRRRVFLERRQLRETGKQAQLDTRSPGVGDRQKFLQLAGVRRGEVQLLGSCHCNRFGVAHRPRGINLACKVARCASERRRIPAAASASKSCISLPEKGRPSAVACISTKCPSPVITTFMSTSARESSSYARSSSARSSTIPTLV